MDRAGASPGNKRGGRKRVIRTRISWTLIFILASVASPARPADFPGTDRVRAVAEKMKAALQKVEDYTSQVEQIYYKKGVEDQRYRFKYFFKKPDRVRVNFIDPHSGLVIFYRRGQKEATVRPFPSLPSIQVDLSVGNSLIQTPTGQGIHQTDMVFFIDFLFRNLIRVPQKDSQFREGKDQVNFLFWARDYVSGEVPEKYRIFISARNWFPVRIERYSPDGNPMEVSIIKDYVFNSHLDDRFFEP
jgi:outer membrane lipoprotein-sorting protein